MADLRLINDTDYRTVLKRRVFTIRKQLRTRIEDEDFPEHDDPLLMEMRLLISIGRLLKVDVRN